MKTTIALMLMLAGALASGIYMAEVDYYYGEFSAGPVYKIDGHVGMLQEPELGYLVKIVADNGDPLFIRKFRPPLFKHRDTFTADKGIPIVQLNDTSFEMALPYYPDGDMILVFNETRDLVLKIDVARFKQQKEVGYKPPEPTSLTLTITGIGIVALLLGGIIIYLRNRQPAEEEPERPMI